FPICTIFLCGLVCVLQALIGHKFPIIEGPAGMWWGVFLVLLQMSGINGAPSALLLRELQTGLMIGAGVFILLAVFRLVGKVKQWLTPAVTGTFLILLAVQVSKSSLASVLGIGFRGEAEVQLVIVLLSVLLIGLTVGLMRKGRGILQYISVLIGLQLGWGVYALLGLTEMPVFSKEI